MSQKVFVVTGSNRGIGYGIVETIAQKVDSAIIYLTDQTNGEESVANLYKTLGDKRKSEIIFHHLDITDEDSVRQFADFLKKKHGKIDVLVNNAGVSFKKDATEHPELQAKVTIGVNYYGTKIVSSHIIPLIKEGGRVVNQCSQNGVIKGKYHQKHIDKLHNAKDEKEIEEFLDEYIRRCKDDTRDEGGFFKSAYAVSKAGEIALTMLYHQRYPHLKINGCCPGYVKTEMSSYKGHSSIQEGADTAVFLAIDTNAPNGKFCYLRKAIDW